MTWKNEYALAPAALAFLGYTAWCLAVGKHEAAAQLIGAGATIGAGYLAWRSAIESGERAQREAAAVRLRSYMAALSRGWAAYQHSSPQMTAEQRLAVEHRLRDAFEGADVITGPTDRCMGGDAGALQFLFNTLRFAALSTGEQRTRSENVLFALQEDVVASIRDRIQRLETGPLSALYELTHVDMDAYRRGYILNEFVERTYEPD